MLYLGQLSFIDSIAVADTKIPGTEMNVEHFLTDHALALENTSGPSITEPAAATLPAVIYALHDLLV